MKDLDEKSYNAIVDRGIITPFYTKFDFYKKAEEELKEILEACDMSSKKTMSDHEAEEVADLITALKNSLIFCGRDPEEEQIKVLIKNRNRAL